MWVQRMIIPPIPITANPLLTWTLRGQEADVKGADWVPPVPRAEKERKRELEFLWIGAGEEDQEGVGPPARGSLGAWIVQGCICKQRSLRDKN